MSDNVGRAGRTEGRYCERHRHPMVAAGIDGPTCGRGIAVDVKSIEILVDPGSQTLELSFLGLLLCAVIQYLRK